MDTEDVLIQHGTNDLVFICFGGWDENFAWKKRITGLNATLLHLKDSKHRWYLDGADGFENLDRTIEFCGDFLKQHSDKRAILLGQSYGAYGALRVAPNLPVHHVIAFAPQTHYVAHRSIYSSQANYNPPKNAIDIRPSIQGIKHCSVSIHVSKTEKENPPSTYFWDDHSHLVGLNGLPNVDVTVHPFHRHAVAWCLTGAGLLDELFQREIAIARGGHGARIDFAADKMLLSAGGGPVGGSPSVGISPPPPSSHSSHA